MIIRFVDVFYSLQLILLGMPTGRIRGKFDKNPPTVTLTAPAQTRHDELQDGVAKLQVRVGVGDA
jgi:hypothetical protein